MLSRAISFLLSWATLTFQILIGRLGPPMPKTMLLTVLFLMPLLLFICVSLSLFQLAITPHLTLFLPQSYHPQLSFLTLLMLVRWQIPITQLFFFDVTTPLPITSRTHAAPPPKYCFVRCNFAEAETRLCAINWSTLLSLDLPVDTLLERFMNACQDVIKATVPVVSPSSFRSRRLPKHIRRVQLAKRHA